MAIRTCGRVYIELAHQKLGERVAYPDYGPEDESPILADYLFEGFVRFPGTSYEYQFQAPLPVSIGHVMWGQPVRRARAAQRRRSSARIGEGRNEVRDKTPDLVAMTDYLAAFLIQSIAYGHSPLGRDVGGDLLEEAGVLARFKAGGLLTITRDQPHADVVLPLDFTQWLLDHGPADARPTGNWEETVWDRHLETFEGFLAFASQETANRMLRHVAQFGELHLDTIPDEENGVRFWRRVRSHAQVLWLSHHTARPRELGVSGYPETGGRVRGARSADIRRFVNTFMTLRDFKTGTP